MIEKWKNINVKLHDGSPERSQKHVQEILDIINNQKIVN